MTSVGDRVLGRYRLDEKIAEGAMGVVWRAFDERLACPVALKGLRGSWLDDDEYRRRLLREARAAAALRRHPHVVTVHEVHDEDPDGRLWIAMDLIEGPSLRDRIRAEGPLSTEAVARLVRHVGSALSAAHARQLVHRDVKPENVLFDTEGTAYLCDFGIVKSYGVGGGETPDAWVTSADHRPGTPPYMAPELVLVGDASPASDQFALAVTTFEALTGKLPWNGGEPASAVRVFAAVLHDDAPPASSLRPGLPGGVDRALARAMEKDPADRYPDIRSFVDALGDALDVAVGMPTAVSQSGGADVPGSTEPTIGPAPSVSAAERSRLLLSGVAAVALLSGVVGSRACEGGGVDGDAGGGPVAGTAAALAGDVACPVFEAFEEGDEQPWLGAAAADEACRRLALLFGGRADTVLRPAGLLRLEQPPAEAGIRDPFDVARARATSLERARAAREQVLDGAVRWDPAAGFAVRLEARRGDRVLGSAEARSDGLHFAIGEALLALERAGHVRRADALDTDARDFGGAPDVEGALFARDLAIGAVGGVRAVPLCQEAQLRGAEAGPAAHDASVVCRTWLERAGREVDAAPPPVLPERQGPRLTWQARLSSGPCAVDPGDCVARLERLRRDEADPYRRSRYAFAQGLLLVDVDAPRAASLFAEAVRRDPSFCLAHDFVTAAETSAFARGHHQWRYLAECPSWPSAWAIPRSIASEGPVPPWADARAYRLGPDNGYVGLRFAESVLDADSADAERLEQVARIGERYLAGPPWLRLAGAYLLARRRLVDGGLGSGRDLLWERLDGLTRFGHATFGDVEALELFRRLELEVFEASPEDRLGPFVDRLLEDPERRLRLDPAYYPLPLLSACIRRDRDRLGACLERLLGLATAAYAPSPHWAPCIDGARHAARGDVDAAADAWWGVVRVVADAAHRRCDVPSRAFDAAGQPDRAEALDARQAAGTAFHGVDPALVSMADRAFDAGDCARGRALAERVVAAWGAAEVDARLSVVDRLRARIAACP